MCGEGLGGTSPLDAMVPVTRLNLRIYDVDLPVFFVLNAFRHAYWS